MGSALTEEEKEDYLTLTASQRSNKKRKTNRKDYYTRNKTKIIASVNKYNLKNKQYKLQVHKELVVLSRELNNCTYCFKPKDDFKFKQCIYCRLKRRNYERRYKNRK